MRIGNAEQLLLVAVLGVGMSHVALAQVAAAKAQSQGPPPAATVRAEGDKGVEGELPLDTAHVPDPKDISATASPVSAIPGPGRGVRIKAETPLSVKLNQAASSGSQRNGDTLTGTLLAPVAASNGTVMKAGTPVKATVLSAAKAGQVQSAGVLSLEVFEVGGVRVTSNVLEFAGREGHRDVADANPEKGTEAMVQAGATLQFKVLGSGDKSNPNERPEKLPCGAEIKAGPGSVSAPSGAIAPH
jgi:hypothetical protein